MATGSAPPTVGGGRAHIGYKYFWAAVTNSDPAGEVILTGVNPSTTQMAMRAPPREFVRISDFASRIKTDEDPGC